MKKGLLFLVTILCLSLVLTGCAKKKTLTCTQKESTMEESMVIVYKGDKIEKGSMSIVMDFTQYKDYIEELKKQDYCKELKEGGESFSKAIKNCEAKWDDAKLNVKLTLDAKALTEEDDFKEKTIEEVKKSLEKEGATCTIK